VVTYYELVTWQSLPFNANNIICLKTHLGNISWFLLVTGPDFLTLVHDQTGIMLVDSSCPALSDSSSTSQKSY